MNQYPNKPPTFRLYTLIKVGDLCMCICLCLCRDMGKGSGKGMGKGEA